MDAQSTTVDVSADKQEQTSKWKSWVKKGGIGVIIFFTVKGIITTTLIIIAALKAGEAIIPLPPIWPG